MSKVSFRARQIDFNKPLPVITNTNDLFGDFPENAVVNRGVPHIPSGMEKEEENEHHFVEVIQALQLHPQTTVKIPVPDILDSAAEYKKNYPNCFSLPKQLVHIRTIVFAEDEPAEYDMDSEDEEWLKNSNLGLDRDRFEQMIDQLERGCGQKVMNLEEAKYLLQDDPALVIAIYDYWLNKRVQFRQPLLFSVRQEKRDGGSNADPYVAFRRRSEKMQTRKNRKNDEQSFEKMLILRDQMESLGEILSRLVKREVLKESLVETDSQCFDTRYKLADWDGAVLSESESLVRKANQSHELPQRISKEPHRKKSRKRKLARRALNLSAHTNSSEELTDAEPDDGKSFAFVRMPGCQYLKPRDPYANLTTPALDNCQLPMGYTLTTVPSVYDSNRSTFTGYARCRVGRGGRVICDRLAAPNDVADYLQTYDKRIRDYVSDSHLGAARRRCILAKDETLFRRLTALIMSSHRGRSSCSLPVCTNSNPPSFQPLSSYPWPVTNRSLTHSPQRTVGEGRFTCNSQVGNLRLDTDNNSSTPVNIVEKDNLSVLQCRLSSIVSTPPLTDVNVTDGSQATALSISGASSEQPSHHPWRNGTRSHGASDAPKPSDFPNCLGTEVPSLGASNGHGRQHVRPPDDRLLLTDSSVLPPSKLRCLTRDYVSRDNTIPSPQLQTANGVSRSQFCRLPI